MLNSNNDDTKLNSSEKRNLVIQAGIQAIPYVGSSLVTLYFGAKQKRRFKRLETFYQEVAQEMQTLKGKIASPEEHDKEALVAIIEELNEKIEREQIKEKQEFFKIYLKNTLIYPVKGNYEERRFFLDILSSMSLLECDILGFLYKQNQLLKVRNIQKPCVDQYAIVGIIGRLKSYGFLISRQSSFSIGSRVDNALNETVKVSDFGRRFFEFCLRL